MGAVLATASAAGHSISVSSPLSGTQATARVQKSSKGQSFDFSAAKERHAQKTANMQKGGSSKHQAPARVVGEDVTDWTELGDATFGDGWMMGTYGLDPAQFGTYKVAVEESASNPGLYRLINPYVGSANPLYGFGVENYETNPVNLIVDATDPECVVVEAQYCGFDEGEYGGKYYVSNQEGIYVLQGKTKEEIKALNFDRSTIENGLISIPTSLFSYKANMDDAYATDCVTTIKLPSPDDFDLASSTMCPVDGAVTASFSCGANVAQVVLWAQRGYFSDPMAVAEQIVAASQNKFAPQDGSLAITLNTAGATEGVNCIIGVAVNAAGEILGAAQARWFNYPDAPEEWTSLGTTTFTDQVMPMLLRLFQPEDLTVEIQQNIADPNKYRLVNPYQGHSMAAEYFYADAHQGCNHYLYLDATDPTNVISGGYMPMGFDLVGNGQLFLGTYNDGGEYDLPDLAVTFADGKFTIPAEALIALVGDYVDGMMLVAPQLAMEIALPGQQGGGEDPGEDPNPGTGLQIVSSTIGGTSLDETYSEEGSLTSNMVLSFSEEVSLDAGKQMTVTGPNGFDKVVEANVFMGSAIFVYTGDLNITESGAYTLNIPAGTIVGTTSGAIAETHLTFNYSNPKSQGGETSELTLDNFWVMKADGNYINVTSTGALPVIANGDQLIIHTNKDAEAGMLVLDIVDNETQEMPISMSEFTQKNAETGYFEKSPYLWTDLKFYEGKEYTIRVTAYDDPSKAPYERVNLGQAELTVTGTEQAYQYSPVQIVSIEPAQGDWMATEITDPTTPIVVTFDGPVELDLEKSYYTEGGQTAELVRFTDQAKPNWDKTAWQITMGEEFWQTSDHDWYFNLYFKDMNGLVVKGDNGENEESNLELQYGCYLNATKVEVAPAAGAYNELYSFEVKYGGGINFSWQNFPYLVDVKGNKTLIDSNDYQILKDGQPIPEDDWTSNPNSLVFHLTEKVTKPGYYTLVMPHGSFALGVEFDGVPDAYQEIEYEVVAAAAQPTEFVNVTLNLSSMVKSEAKAVKGQPFTVTAEAGADWKVEKVIINGVDLAEGENGYTIAELAEDTEVEVVLAYAHELTLVDYSGIGEINGENGTVKVYNDGEYIVVEGVAKGEVVYVYTVNGQLIAQQSAGDLGAVQILAPQGAIYIVRVGGAENAVKIQH